jgi:hypothetical protein
VEAQRRQSLTLDYAEAFLRAHRAGGCRFEPWGVAQGWSPKSYAFAVRDLQRLGYRYIALGGMVPLKTNKSSSPSRPSMRFEPPGQDSTCSG